MTDAITLNVNKKFYIHTFGCQMNVHDSGKMAGLLQGMGYEEATGDADADVILFNTCTVREHAHHKAISEIGRVIHMKKRKPKLIVGVCGCVAQEERERLFEIYPDINLVFGPDQIANLPRLLSDVMPHASCLLPRRNEAGSRKQETGKVIATELIDDPNEYNWVKYSLPFVRGGKGWGRDLPPLTPPSAKLPADRYKGGECPVTAFVTIMKGCNNNCSFCIVPHVRGREVSRPTDDIVEEINGLVKNGVKEVTLLGQNVNSFRHALSPSPLVGEGRGEGGREAVAPLCKGGTGGISPFVQLLQRISKETNVLRIRYMSPHPKDLGDDLIEEHAANPKLCRNMHLPLQAGSDRILRAMKRSYNKKQFIERALKLRERAEGIDITTDVIVGFPGETEKDYQDTLDVVREVAFDGMYAFKYSPRPGTKAAELTDDVPLKEKDARLQRLLELNVQIWKKKTQRLIGTVQDVLVEGMSKRSVVAELALPELGVANFSSRYSAIHRGLKPATPDFGKASFATTALSHQLTGRTFANKIVNFAGNLNLVGHIVAVEITDARPNSLKGRLK